MTSSPLAVWTDHGRFAFDSGSPVRTALPADFALGDGALGLWPVNARGDVLLVAGTGLYDVHALAQDASGTSAATRVTAGPGRRILHSAASLAPDATAVIAWTEQRDPPRESDRARRVGAHSSAGGTVRPDLDGAHAGARAVCRCWPARTGPLRSLTGGRPRLPRRRPGGSPVAVAEVAELYDLTLAPGRWWCTPNGPRRGGAWTWRVRCAVRRLS